MTTFDGRQPSMEDKLRWKTTFDRVFSILPEITLRLLTLTATAKLTQNRKFYQLFKPEIEFDVMGETYAVRGITPTHMCRKADIFRSKRLSIYHELCIVNH